MSGTGDADGIIQHLFPEYRTGSYGVYFKLTPIYLNVRDRFSQGSVEGRTGYNVPVTCKRSEKAQESDPEEAGFSMIKNVHH
jgi:hypothetical protein